MTLAALRALVLESNLAAHGVDVTVTRPHPNDTAIATSGILVTPDPLDQPSVMSIRRQDAHRILLLAKSAVPSVPKGTHIVAPKAPGGALVRWVVDGLEREEADQWRVYLVEDPEDL